jgi:hypothetical protein
MNSLTHLYSVEELVLSDGSKIRFDDVLAAQLIVHSSQVGQLIVTTPANVLDGPVNLIDVINKRSAKLKEIRYAIIGTADMKHVRTQRYHHEFKAATQIDEEWFITTSAKSLFVPYQLDVLLDTKEFPKVTAIQFIS